MDAAFWDDEYRRDPESVNVPDRLLADLVTDLPPGRALDLGCGDGRNALMLARRGWSLLGIDFSPTAVALAQAAAQVQGLDARFAVADVSIWEPSESFDLVYSTYALPPREAREAFLAMADEALRPGGTLIIIEWDRAMAPVWGIAADELVSPQELVDLLPGLVVLRAETHPLSGMFPPDDPRGGRDPVHVALVQAEKPAAR